MTINESCHVHVPGIRCKTQGKLPHMPWVRAGCHGGKQVQDITLGDGLGLTHLSVCCCEHKFQHPLGADEVWGKKGLGQYFLVTPGSDSVQRPGRHGSCLAEQLNKATRLWFKETLVIAHFISSGHTLLGTQ